MPQYLIAFIWLAPPRAVGNGNCIKTYRAPPRRETNRYATASAHYAVRTTGQRQRMAQETCVAAAFACALYTRQVDGSPRRRTPLVIRARMALPWLIIDAATMWQLLINTHAGRMAQTRCAVTIGKEARGERWEGRGGRDVAEERNDSFAAEVCVQVQCDIPVAEMTVMNCINGWGTFSRNRAEGREVFTLDCRSTIKKQWRNKKFWNRPELNREFTEENTNWWSFT